MTFPRLSVLAAAAVALAAIVAGCGGGSSTDTTSTSAANSSSQGGAASTVAGAEVSELGEVLVDSKGLTVYDFGKDQGTTSSCYGECAKFWPPVLTKGEPTAGEGADSSQLGTTERKDGTTQVTYAGHPLYTFAEDKSPGEANGNGVDAFGGVWDALNESGEPAEEGSSESGGGAVGGY